MTYGDQDRLFTIEGSPTRPKQPPIIPIYDNVVGWLGTAGILAALRRRAIEGGLRAVNFRWRTSSPATVLLRADEVME